MRAHITLLYLFDVAESVETVRAAAAIPAASQESRAADASPNVHYPNPPLTFRGADVEAPRVNGLDARVRTYDYGVISLAFTQTFEGTWPELVALGATLIDNGPLDAEAEACCRVVVTRLADAFNQPREAFLSEDYAVFAVTPGGWRRRRAACWRSTGRTSPGCCAVNRGRSARRRSRRCCATGSRIWTTISSSRPGTRRSSTTPSAGPQTAVEIMEFGNSQLLQFRYYDQLLDAELARLYDELQQDRRPYLVRRAALHARRAPGPLALHRRPRAARPN